MNVKIEMSHFVAIEGLAESAVASSDAQLLSVLDFANRASDYLPEDAFEDDVKVCHPVLQLREAVLEELSRRRGDGFNVDLAMAVVQDDADMGSGVKLWAS